MEFNDLSIFRWVHFLSGITWIGLLYFFNLVQMPAMAAALADKDGPGPAAIGKYIAPRALLWFRWGAVVTWLSGMAYLKGGVVDAFTFGMMIEGGSIYFATIGMGAWLGTIMLFNVWAIIWPNQQKILGMVDASADEIAKAKVVAMMASRTNVALSIPMLLFMGSAAHGLPF